MSAFRDKNQGFGFVYTNLGKTLGDAQEGLIDPPKGAKVLNFNKDANFPVREKELNSVEQIRENLDRLKKLQEKIDKMLIELNTLNKRSPK